MLVWLQGSEDESRIALTRRMKICCLVESLPPVKASDLAIPKMAHLVAEDKKQQCQLEKVIDGLQDSLLAANEDEMQILQELEVRLLQVTTLVVTDH